MSARSYLESPYLDDEKAVWLRGNLHTHTTRSDGRNDPQTVIKSYAGLGYEFLALSDHDVAADYGGLDPCGMVLVPANEVSSGGPHVLHVGAEERVEPLPDRQAVIDAINRTAGFAVLCHPDWEVHFNHYTYELMLELSGYAGIEVYNGGVLEGPGSPFALSKWDRLLSAGRMVRGFANDDSHGAHHWGRGWNVARVRERTPEAVLEALRKGSFYASSGVEIEEIACDGATLHVVAPNAETIALVGEHGGRLHVCGGPELVFDASEAKSPYIRVECWGHGDSRAWSQPILVRGGLAEKLQKLAEEKPVLRAHRAEHAPELSGRVDDPLWEKAEATTRFMRIADAGEPDVRTEVRCVVAEGTVHFAARCEEPRLEGLKTNMAEDGNPSLWTDDSVEIFLDIEGKGARYFHVMVNAKGVTYIGLGRGKPSAGRVRAIAGRYPGGWCVELAIPLDSLGASAGPGECWGFHTCRNRKPVHESYVWSWVGKSNHTPTRFGWLEFQAGGYELPNVSQER